MRCPTCNFPVGAGQQICDGCGANLSAAHLEETISPQKTGQVLDADSWGGPAPIRSNMDPSPDLTGGIQQASGQPPLEQRRTPQFHEPIGSATVSEPPQEDGRPLKDLTGFAQTGQTQLIDSGLPTESDFPMAPAPAPAPEPQVQAQQPPPHAPPTEHPPSQGPQELAQSNVVQPESAQMFPGQQSAQPPPMVETEPMLQQPPVEPSPPDMTPGFEQPQPQFEAQGSSQAQEMFSSDPNPHHPQSQHPSQGPVQGLRQPPSDPNQPQVMGPPDPAMQHPQEMAAMEPHPADPQQAPMDPQQLEQQQAEEAARQLQEQLNTKLGWLFNEFLVLITSVFCCFGLLLILMAPWDIRKKIIFFGATVVLWIALGAAYFVFGFMMNPYALN